MLEDVRRSDVGHIEGRVLAHQDDIDPCQIQRLGRSHREVIADLAAHLERSCLGDSAAIAQGQILGQIMVQAVPAGLRLQRQSEGGIAIDIDGVDRIHLDCYG